MDRMIYFKLSFMNEYAESREDYRNKRTEQGRTEIDGCALMSL